MVQRIGSSSELASPPVEIPRDLPCAQVNPLLWERFLRQHGPAPAGCELLTEAYCVQWLDLMVPARSAGFRRNYRNLSGSYIDG